MASLSGFATWVQTQDQTAFVMGDPTKGIGDLPLPPLEPRGLDEKQIQSLQNLCDRLRPFYHSRNRKRLLSNGEAPLEGKTRPWRNRAKVIVLLSTRLRWEELVNLNLSQLGPKNADELRQADEDRLVGSREGENPTRCVFVVGCSACLSRLCGERTYRRCDGSNRRGNALVFGCD